MKTFKKVIGWCILLNIVPLIGILAVCITPKGILTLAGGYLIGWILQIIGTAFAGLVVLSIKLITK